MPETGQLKYQHELLFCVFKNDALAGGKGGFADFSLKSGVNWLKDPQNQDFSAGKVLYPSQDIREIEGRQLVLGLSALKSSSLYSVFGASAQSFSML